MCLGNIRANFLGVHFSRRANFSRGMYGGMSPGEIILDAQVPLQDHKFLCEAVTICATLVNRQTHTDRHTEGFWSVTYGKLSARISQISQVLTIPMQDLLPVAYETGIIMTEISWWRI